MTDPSEYLNATDETGAVAAADLMDRLTERLKATDGWSILSGGEIGLGRNVIGHTASPPGAAPL
jgi:hypothetical protein